jgi:cob(I)alamin adenosyltransferase
MTPEAGVTGFEWSVRLGDLLVISTFFASFLFRSGGNVKELQMAVQNALQEISDLKKTLAKVNDLLTQVAVQDERLNMLMKWYDELRKKLEETHH